jgi:hypothetical protein
MKNPWSLLGVLIFYLVVLVICVFTGAKDLRNFHLLKKQMKRAHRAHSSDYPDSEKPLPQ